MNKVLLVSPVFRRFELTRIMLKHRRAAITAARQLGVDAQCVCIGDEENLKVAESHGFATIPAPNILGSKYNDGHEYAVNMGYTYSLHCNSDQTFTPEFLKSISSCPTDRIIRTHWMTFIKGDGKSSLTFANPMWALKIYPTALLKSNPRPCNEEAMRMCDTSTRDGVVAANPDMPDMHTLDIHALDALQWESGFQMTPWSKNLKVASWTGKGEEPVPWDGIANSYGPELVSDMKGFYGLQ